MQDCAEVISKLAAHLPEYRVQDPNEKIYTFVNQRALKEAIDNGQPLRIEKYGREHNTYKDIVKTALLEEFKSQKRSDRKPYTFHKHPRISSTSMQ